MNIDQIENRIITYFENPVSEKERHALTVLAKNNKEVQALWESYSDLYASFENEVIEKPDPKLKSSYLQWLDQESKKSSNTKIISISWLKRSVGVAAILILTFFAWKIFDRQQILEESLADVQRDLMDYKQQSSSSERIKAIKVNYQNTSNNVDQQMIALLFDVLDKDPSSNVRLTAVESLADHVEKENVRAALLSAMRTETDAAVKLAIIHSLSHAPDNKTIISMKELVNDDSQQRFVKDEIYKLLIRQDNIKI